MYKAAQSEAIFRALLKPVTLLCTPSVMLQWKDAHSTKAHLWRHFRLATQNILKPYPRK
jgi:hypothetical protein